LEERTTLEKMDYPKPEKGQLGKLPLGTKRPGKWKRDWKKLRPKPPEFKRHRGTKFAKEPQL